jgi:sigma-E factor negative regulatory protein RseC
MATTGQQEGIIIETAGKMAKVKTSRHNDCANCGSCPGNSAAVLDVRNPVGAKVGQKVIIELQEVNMLKAAFTVYILPLLALLVGATTGGAFAAWAGTAETLSRVLGAVIAFAGSIWYIRHYDYSVRMDDKMQPVVVHILT